MDEEIEFSDYVVTCHTDDCINNNLAIPIPAPTINPFFVCGGCTNQITDIEMVGS